jgi:hypothetical protein
MALIANGVFCNQLQRRSAIDCKMAVTRRSAPVPVLRRAGG